MFLLQKIETNVMKSSELGLSAMYRILKRQVQKELVMNQQMNYEE